MAWYIVFYRQNSIEANSIPAIFSWWYSLLNLKSFLLLYLVRSLIIVNVKTAHQVTMTGPELFAALILILVSQIDFFDWFWATLEFFILKNFEIRLRHAHYGNLHGSGL